MKPRTLLVLALLVAALAAFVWFVDRDLPSSAERAERAKKVLAFEKEAVRAITLAHGDATARLERAAPEPGATSEAEGKADADAGAGANGGWSLTAPLAAPAPADRWAVDRLLDSLAGLEKQRELPDADRAALGLEAPRASVTLEWAGGALTLDVGAKMPAAPAMAVAVRGSTDAAVVPDALFADLTKPAGDWRARELFTAPREAVERITLEADGRRLLFARRGETFWLESPAADLADRPAVETLLGDLAALRAQEFFDAPDAGVLAALARPEAAIEIVVRGQARPVRIELGGPVPASATRRVARVGETTVAVETTLGETARKPVDAWRSTAWSSLEVYRIDKARFEPGPGAGASAVDLARDAGDWKRGGEVVAFTPVSDLLYAAAGARARRIVSRQEATALGADLAAADLTVTLVAADGSEETLRRHRALASTGEVPATTSNRDAVLLLDAATATEIDGKLEVVRQAQPTPPAEAGAEN